MMDVVGTLRRAWANAVAHLDFPLLLITAAIMAIGLGTVYSATYDSTHRMMSQAGNMGIALVVMWVVSRIPPQKLMSFAIPLYVIGIVLLIAVFLFGIKVNGARRWLSIGFTRVQPSEIMKIAMPLMLAWYFHKYEATLKLRHYGVAALLLLVPFALVAKQPDLGTALLIGAAGFYVIFFAGLPWKIIVGLIAAAGAALLGQLLARNVFQLDLPPGFWIFPLATLAGAALAVAIGWLAVRRLLMTPPMLALRAGA